MKDQTNQLHVHVNSCSKVRSIVDTVKILVSYKLNIQQLHAGCDTVLLLDDHAPKSISYNEKFPGRSARAIHYHVHNTQYIPIVELGQCFVISVALLQAMQKPKQSSGKSDPGQLNQGCIFFDLKGFSFVFVCFLWASGLTYNAK